MRYVASLIFAMFLAAPLAGDAAAATPWSKYKTDKVESIVDRYFEFYTSQHGPMALSIGVSVAGKLVVSKGWGDARPGLAADGDTRYQIGSLTKQFTAAGILKLTEDKRFPAEERLTLEQPVGSIFGGATSWQLAGAPPITIRSLLTMTSKLPNFTRDPPPETDPWGAMPADRLLSEIKKWSPTGWPNSFTYSNTSYFLLSEVIERQCVGGRADHGVCGGYQPFLKEALFVPAGMKRTGFAGDMPHGSIAEPNFQRHGRPAFGHPDWFKGSGDIVSSVRDIFAWDRALMEGDILSKRARKAMFTPWARITPSLAYGMGFYVERAPGMTIYSHSGTVPGYTAFNAIIVEDDDPSWISVTVLTNCDGITDLQRMADSLAIVALE